MRRPLIDDDLADILILIPLALVWLLASGLALIWRQLRAPRRN